MADETGVPMRIRMAAVILAYGGRAPSRALRRVAIHAGYDGTRDAPSGYNAEWAKAVYDFTKTLKREGLLVRAGDDWVAPDVLALMDWVATRIDRHLEYHNEPTTEGASDA